MIPLKFEPGQIGRLNQSNFPRRLIFSYVPNGGQPHLTEIILVPAVHFDCNCWEIIVQDLEQYTLVKISNFMLGKITH